MRAIVDLDMELVREAADVLGTRTTVETVNAALREAVNRSRRLDYVQALADGDVDLSTAKDAWR